ncbi:MAG TPA: NUDIX hydrolase [Conexibacter sp.]|jgi:8-oxo-dGTP pyrophosphatase MutT (NUDIX family)|nr:NUDIX hydrolase [Conexibacter sp.]
MEPAQPGPGEELNTGAVTTPRLAASVIVLRGADRGLEVLLVQRNPASRFMGGAWVFPGGAVDEIDGAGGDEAALRAAGVREVAEEAGIAIGDPAQLVPFSRWITPAAVKIRFDTWFFLSPVADDTAPAIDGGECVDWRWSTPQAALDAHAAGELMLVFPTIKHLEQLAAFPHAEALVGHARGRTVEPVEPRVVLEGEVARVLLPGDPGYAADEPPAEA